MYVHSCIYNSREQAASSLFMYIVYCTYLVRTAAKVDCSSLTFSRRGRINDKVVKFARKIFMKLDSVW